MGFYVTVYAPKEVKEKEENNVKLAIFVCPFGHCIVCPLIYGFWYSFAIFKLFFIYSS
jgi:hypothetical protein